MHWLSQEFTCPVIHTSSTCVWRCPCCPFCIRLFYTYNHFHSCVWLLYTYNHLYSRIWLLYTCNHFTPVFDYFTPTTILLLYLTTLHLQPFYSCIWLLYTHNHFTHVFDYFTPTSICTPVFDYFTPTTILLLYLTTLHLQPFYSCTWLLYTYNHFTPVFDSCIWLLFTYNHLYSCIWLLYTYNHFYSCIWLLKHLQPFSLLYFDFTPATILLLYLSIYFSPTTTFTPVFD